MTLLTQNAKMRKSSKNGTSVFNFGIPAFRSETGIVTCPNAKACVVGCYARQGAYVWDNVTAAYEARLALTFHPETFFYQMAKEIATKFKTANKRGQQLVIRVHDAGDFYSESYQLLWYRIALNFPNVQFYAYTKMISQSKLIDAARPSNFKLIYSFGGKEDSLIDTNVDAHSVVFSSEVELAANDYVDVTQDDMFVFKTNKIGLVYHGTKSYKNTTWNKVDLKKVG